MIQWLQRNILSRANSSRRRSLFFTGALLLILTLVYLASRIDLLLQPLSHTTSRNRNSSGSSWPSLSAIPPKIWQIYFGYSEMGDQIGLLNTWILKNQDYAYTLVSNEGADAFAQKHYSDRPDVLSTFLELKMEGGVYSDLDADDLHPINDWIPKELQSSVHAIVGIEYDQLGKEAYTGMVKPLQSCQWTMATSRGHPIMKKAVEEAVKAIRKIAHDSNTMIADLQPLDKDVVKVTGPVIWTTAIMESLSEATGTNMSYLNMTGMTEPKLFGDIYVLPVNGFGTGQPHSNSWVNGGNPPEALIRHIWNGSWKHGLGNKFSGG